MRVPDLKIEKGDVIRIQRDDRDEDDAEYCIIDLADLENIASPLEAPSNSLSITDKSFLAGDFTDDYTEAFKNCLPTPPDTRKSTCIQAGTFKLTWIIIL